MVCCCCCCCFNIFLLVVCCAGDVFFSFLQTCSSSVVVVVVADYLHTNKHPKEIDKKVIIKRQLKTLKKHSLNVKYNNILTNMYTIWCTCSSCFCISVQDWIHETQEASKQLLLRAAPPGSCKRKLNEEKVKRCQFDSANWFWPCIHPLDACTGKRHCKT